jgi:hypothetical protein
MCRCPDREITVVGVGLKVSCPSSSGPTATYTCVPNSDIVRMEVGDNGNPFPHGVRQRRETITPPNSAMSSPHMRSPGPFGSSSAGIGR